MSRATGEMRFTKIRFDGRRTRLEYEILRRGGDPDEYVLACNDQPLPPFVEALHGLVVDVLNICEFPPSEKPKFQVRGVSIGYVDGVMGAVITALRALMTSDAPLLINSPYLPERPRESDPDGFRLPAATVRRIRALCEEAERYVMGERLYEGSEA